MPKYLYQAKALNGKIIHGHLQAKNAEEAKLLLQNKKLIPLKILVASQVQNFISARSKSSFSGSFFEPKVSLKQLQVFTQQFATLIYAGLPILEALQILITHLPKTKVLYRVLSQVKMRLEEGQNLSQAMEAFPKVFDAFYINMVKAGEKGGVLDKVLRRLANTLEKKRKLRKDMISASLYPLTIMTFSILIMMGVFVFVIPQFAQIYQKSNQQLPMMTSWVLHISNMVRLYWHIILFGMLAVPFMFFYSYQTSSGRRFWDTFLAHFPFLKALIQKSSIAYFTQTLSSLLNAGVHMLESIGIASETCNNIFYQNILEKSSNAIKQGASLSNYLNSQSSYIPAMLTQMIAVGEQSGNIDFMLEKVAQFYEEELESIIKNILSFIEPMMIIVFGFVIAFIILSIYLPIFNSSQFIGS